MEEAPKKFFRLKPEGEVRLKNAYIIKCEEVIKDEQGNIVELHCSYDPDSKTGGKTAGRKIKGTIHWVNASTALDAQVRLYDYLLNDEEGAVNGDFIASLNPNSLVVLDNCKMGSTWYKIPVLTSRLFLRRQR